MQSSTQRSECSPPPPSSSWATRCRPPASSHVHAVLAHPEPTNISELQAFLGTVDFYCRSSQRRQGSWSRSLTCSSAARNVRSRSAWATCSEPPLWRPRTPWRRPRAWCTLPRVSSSASWWILLLITSAVPCSNGDGQRTRASPLDFSPGSWTALRSSTQLSTESYWRVSRPSATSVSCWKGGGSSCSPTTSRSPPLSAGWQSRGQPSSATSWPTLLSSRAISSRLWQCDGRHAVQAAWRHRRRRRFGVSPARHSPRRPGRQGHN